MSEIFVSEKVQTTIMSSVTSSVFSKVSEVKLNLYEYDSKTVLFAVPSDHLKP